MKRVAEVEREGRDVEGGQGGREGVGGRERDGEGGRRM